MKEVLKPFVSIVCLSARYGPLICETGVGARTHRCSEACEGTLEFLVALVPERSHLLRHGIEEDLFVAARDPREDPAGRIGRACLRHRQGLDHLGVDGTREDREQLDALGLQLRPQGLGDRVGRRMTASVP